MQAWRLGCLLLGMVMGVVGGWAGAAVYNLPPKGSDVVGHLQHIKTKAADTFVALARRYDVGYRELRQANPKVDPWLPGNGTPVVIPSKYVLPDAPRRGIVVNIPEMRIYYYPPKNSPYAGKVVTYPIGIGRQGWDTPLSQTKIVRKEPHPIWIPPQSIKKEHAKNGDPLPNVVPAGPDNPLGQYALHLCLPGYLIHGTDKPAGVGMKVSHGCIRLFPEDIAALFSMVNVDTPVAIVSQPYKVGWDGATLYLESHPPDAIGDESVHSYTPWVSALVKATKHTPKAPVEWSRAQQIVEKADGVPEPIGTDPARTGVADTAGSGRTKPSM